MGIQGLWSFLKTKHANVMHDIAGLDGLRGKRFVLDVSGEMHGIVERGADPNEVFPRMDRDLKQLDITTTFIFDGKRCPAKVFEHERRSDARQQLRDRKEEHGKIIQHLAAEEPTAETIMKRAEEQGGELKRMVDKHQRLNVDLGGTKMELELDVEALVQEIQAKHDKQAGRSAVTDEHYQGLIRTLDDRGLPYLIALTEAEKLCAQLVRDGKADVVVSNDGDTLTFGATCMLRNFGRDSSRYPTQIIYLAEVIDSMGVGTYESFVDFCILCGCDFTESRGLPTVGPAAALKIIQKHKTIDAYLGSTDWVALKHKLANSEKWAPFTLDQFQYQVARQMFLDKSDQVMPVTSLFERVRSPVKRRHPPSDDSPKQAKREETPVLPPPEF